MSLAEVENMAVLQLFTLGGSGGLFSQKIMVILGVLRCILMYSEAYRETHIASWEEAHHLIIIACWATGTLEAISIG